MEVLTEMDEYFNAMSKINMDEPVMPYVKGRLVESDTYNKVQKILNTPELEKAHMYCYDLDLENLEECDVAKINNLYKLGVERGFIDDDFQYQDCGDGACCKAEEVVVKEPEVKQNPRAKIPCFVAMYSAMKDGQIRTGEAYSRAISVQAAKSDVLNQLSKLGYSNISILAVEATEEDACCSSCCGKTEDVAPAPAALGGEIEEDDYLKGRVHNNHLPEAEEAEKDDSAEDDSGSEEKDDSTEDVSDDSSEETNSDSETSDAEDDSADDTDDEAKADDTSADGEDSADSEDDSAEDDSAKNDAEDDSEEEDTDAKDDSETSDDSDDEDADEDSEEDKPEELDDNKKADLKDNYKRIFKNTMLKCKFEDKTFDDLTIADKVKFFTELSKAWKEDHEPSEFMSDKEIDQLNKITIKK